MRNLSSFYILAFLICLFKFTSASEIQVPEYFYYQRFDNRNGLSNSAVNKVFQDKDQLVWIGTWDGLNMYDGTDFRVFNYTSENQSGSIGNNIIQDIKEDKTGNIWISTIGGITRFEKSSGKFYTYFYNLATKTSIAEKEYELAIVADGTVFCSSKTFGLSRFDLKTNRFKNIPQLSGKEKILKMESSRKGMMWCLQSDGILVGCKVTPTGFSSIKTFQLNDLISNFFLVNDHIFLSDNKNNLFEIDQQFNVKTVARFSNGIKLINYYQSNYIIAWDSQGVSTFNQHFEPSVFMKDELKQLANSKVTTIASAKDEVLWIGTDGNGLIKIYPKINHFGLVNKNTISDLNKPVRTFEGVNGDLWIGTKGKGIVILNNFWKEFKQPRSGTDLTTANGLENNSVYALKKGVYPYVYIGTDGKGIGVYDLKRKQIVRWSEIAGTAKLPSFGSVYAILQDPDKSLWLGTSGSGLIHLDFIVGANGSLRLKYLKQYLSNKGNGPANDIIYALSDAGDGRLWIACRYGGLSVLNKKTGEFKTFKAFSYPNSLSNNDVLSLYQDKQKRLWIGTSYGLNMLSFSESQKEKPLFRKFTMNEGLPNNTIHSIEGTRSGSIWVSTNKGLASVNPANGAIANFRESDGLQSNEFSDGAVWKSPDGALYFGGIYGFNYFLPEKIISNKTQPNLLVSAIQMGGKNREENIVQVLKKTKDNIPEYILDRKSNFFQIKLKSMSFLNEAKNEFAYKLEGLDKNWIYSGTIGNIAYNNIPPGKYTLSVRWSNGEGVWTKGVSVFTLRVEQYLWLTYPALFFYLLLVIGSGYSFYSYRKNKLNMKYRLQMEHLLREKDEEEHEQRLKFFTNIAHEIQTPLTMIMGSVEHFLQIKGNDYFISMVHQHTARLTYLVQQLMEFRKAEAGFLIKNNDYVDISKMLDSLSVLFIPVSERNSQIYIREVQGDVAGFLDKDKMEKILYNLLSNAFKHSGKEETIKFKSVFNIKENILQISVSNSGCRLDTLNLQQIFNNFYVSNEHQEFSTGIGLAFAKELVTLMGGDIKVDLENEWIEFTVTLQLDLVAVDGKDAKVITSAPSSLYESLVKVYEHPDFGSSEEENKNSLIDTIQQKKMSSILLVEDDPELRYLIRNILKAQYIIYEANNGRDALNFLYKTTPSLIISDVMMPDMNGLELCKTVKQTPAMAQIPFIILSARGSEDNKSEGYELGADAYIPKPFQISYLHVRIRKLLDYQARMKNLIKDQNITNQFMDADIADTDKKFLESLLKVIDANLNEPDLNAAILENALSISKMQLYRKLKSLAGMTPAEFIKRIRLKHAADMLLTSQYTVSEIFYRTGFNNKSYFFREFKKIYHCAPNEYRQQQYEENLTSL